LKNIKPISIVIFIFILVLLAGIFTACELPGDNPLAQSSFSAGPDQNKFTADENFIQIATGIEGSGATTYSSSDANVATVDTSTGEVDILTVGTTLITVFNSGDVDFNDATDDYVLIVSDSADQISFSAGLDLNKITTDENFTQSATGVEGSGVTTYSSSDTDIATVDSSTGEVDVLASGITTITVTNSGDNAYNQADDTYLLTVSKLDQVSFSAGSDQNKIAADGNFINAAIGVEGSGVTTYSSSDTDIATVSSTGEVNIITGGFSRIRVSNPGDENFNSASDSYLLIVGVPNITTWKTTVNGESITIPTNYENYTYNYYVDWGDNSDPTNENGNATHTYETANTHTVKILGTFPAPYFNNSGIGDRAKIYTVEQWGEISFLSMESAYEGCTNLTISATDNPDLSSVTDMGYMFHDASSLIGITLSGWDTSNITSMMYLFGYAVSFNGNISSWNVENVEGMEAMFYGAATFNQDLSGWVVADVTTMQMMFNRAESFNQNIGNWNVSSVTTMSAMFWNAYAFNQDLSGWDVSSNPDHSSFSGNWGGSEASEPNWP